MQTPIVFAAGLCAFVLAGPALAQDTVKADVASAAATNQSAASTDRHKSRAERRAEAAAKADAKSETLAQFPKADGAAAASTASAQPKMECRSQAVTGSRLGKRVCATPEQWAQADEAAAESIRQMRSDANAKGGVARPGGPYTVGGGP